MYHYVDVYYDRHIDWGFGLIVSEYEQDTSTNNYIEVSNRPEIIKFFDRIKTYQSLKVSVINIPLVLSRLNVEGLEEYTPFEDITPAIWEEANKGLDSFILRAKNDKNILLVSEENEKLLGMIQTDNFDSESQIPQDIKNNMKKIFVPENTEDISMDYIIVGWNDTNNKINCLKPGTKVVISFSFNIKTEDGETETIFQTDTWRTEPVGSTNDVHRGNYGSRDSVLFGKDGSIKNLAKDKRTVISVGFDSNRLKKGFEIKNNKLMKRKEGN